MLKALVILDSATDFGAEYEAKERAFLPNASRLQDMETRLAKEGIPLTLYTTP
jgi:hypothetical protein